MGYGDVVHRQGNSLEPLLARPSRKMAGRACPLCPGNSDIDLLSYRQCIVYLEPTEGLASMRCCAQVVQMNDPSLLEMAADDLSVNLANAHAACTIVVFLRHTRVSVAEQGACEVGGAATVRCRSRGGCSAEQVR